MCCSLSLYARLLALLLLLTSCDNTDPTTGTTQVAGQVVQRQSRQPVGKGTVQVYLISGQNYISC